MPAFTPATARLRLAPAVAPLLLLLLLLLSLAVPVVAVAAAAAAVAPAPAPPAAATSLPHACAALGGVWLKPPAAPQPTCRLYMQHGGVRRYADVYLPAGYGGGAAAKNSSGGSSSTTRRRYPLLVMMHGLTHANWTPTAVARAVGHAADGAEIEAARNGFVPLLTGGGGGAIVVYPSATGDLRQRQMWNSEFWGVCRRAPKEGQRYNNTAVLGGCIEPGVDDVGFVSRLLTDELPRRLAVDRSRVFLGGYSNGGMLVQALLCRAPGVATKTLASVALFATALGDAWWVAPAPCAAPARVPMLFVHGTEDDTLPYSNVTVEVYDTTMWSGPGMVRAWATKLGCRATPTPAPAYDATLPPEAAAGNKAGRVSCVECCGSSQRGVAAATSKPPPPLLFCKVANGDHTNLWEAWGAQISKLAWRFLDGRGGSR